MRKEKHRLVNAPHVDNSCKWAGGGFLSNVPDLLRFGNAMLYSFQQRRGTDKPGFLVRIYKTHLLPCAIAFNTFT